MNQHILPKGFGARSKPNNICKECRKSIFKKALKFKRKNWIILLSILCIFMFFIGQKSMSPMNFELNNDRAVYLLFGYIDTITGTLETQGYSKEQIYNNHDIESIKSLQNIVMEYEYSYNKNMLHEDLRAIILQAEKIFAKYQTKRRLLWKK